MSPAKSANKARGRKQKVEECKKEKEEPVQTRKGRKIGSDISPNTNENVRGKRNDKGKSSEVQGKKRNICSKGKSNKDEEKNGEIDNNEKSQDEETKSPKIRRKGRQQNGKPLTTKAISSNGGKVSKGKESDPILKPSAVKTASKTHDIRTKRRGRRVMDSEEDESESEKEKSEHSQKMSEEEEESKSLEETAETEASKESSEEGASDTDNKIVEEENVESKEEMVAGEEEANGAVKSEITVESEEESSNSEEEVESEEQLSDKADDKQEEPPLPSKKPQPLRLASHLQGQKVMLKSKMLLKKDAIAVEKPSENAPASEETEKKKMALRKTDVLKGKSQILQLASKSKKVNKIEVNKIEEIQKEEETVSPSKGSKGLLNKQPLMLFTMKGKGKDDKNKNASKVDQSVDEINAETTQKPKRENLRLGLGMARIASLRYQAKKKKLNEQTATEISETEETVSSKLTERLIAQKKGVTTLHRVSGWIQKKVPQRFNVRRKFAAVTQAIGISRWLPSLVLKKKNSPTKSKKTLLRHKMALKMAGSSIKTNKRVPIPENVNTELRTDTQETFSEDPAEPCGEPCSSQQDTEEKANSGDAKYAIVFPRINKIGKGEDTVAPASTSTGNGLDPERKPPKPGARLVLPVKPDLSILKSVNRSNATNQPERSSEEQVLERRKGATIDSTIPTMDKKDASALQAAKGKLVGSQINLTKLAMSKPLLAGGRSIVQSMDGEQRDKKLGQAVPSAKAEPWIDGLGTAFYEDEEDREVAELMGDGLLPSTIELHWAQHQQMCSDPQDWLRSENLPPHQTREKLTKWTVYQDDEHAQTIPIPNGRGPWESEDPAQNMLESRLNSTQV